MKTLNSIEKITLRIMIANFNGNPITTVISCYSPTNVTDEDTMNEFYNNQSSLARDTPKHNVLLIGGDFNAKIGCGNTSYHQSTNRNGTFLSNFSVENELCILNTKFQKRIGKLWTFQYPNHSKA